MQTVQLRGESGHCCAILRHSTSRAKKKPFQICESIVKLDLEVFPEVKNSELKFILCLSQNFLKIFSSFLSSFALAEFSRSSFSPGLDFLALGLSTFDLGRDF